MITTVDQWVAAKLAEGPDWREVAADLLAAVEQADRAPTGLAAQGVKASALECVKALLAQTEGSGRVRPKISWEVNERGELADVQVGGYYVEATATDGGASAPWWQIFDGTGSTVPLACGSMPFGTPLAAVQKAAEAAVARLLTEDAGVMSLVGEAQ